MENVRLTGRRLGSLSALVMVTPLLAACGSSSRTATPPASNVGGKVTVFAAASLTDSFTALGKSFEAAHPGTTITFSFGASSTLSMQITSGAPADVFASASSKNLASVVAAGDAFPGRTFATNTAEIAVSPASRSKISQLSDLAAKGVKVSLCQAQVPCGALADAVLAKASVTVTPVTRGLDVKSVLASVVSGEVDAGIVYVTDVRAAGTSVAGVPIPAADNASTDYPISVIKTSKNPALARAFSSYVLSAAGEAVLAQAGFARP